MRIEFRYWPGNTEVVLIEDIGDWPRVKRSFYTSAKRMGVTSGNVLSGETGKFDAEFYFDFLEEVAPPPIIGGEFGHLHPYWAERKAKRMAREGITQQDIAETMPPQQGEL